MNWKKALKMGLCGAMTFAVVAGGGIQAEAAKAVAPTQQVPCYKTVTEVFDWGPSVSKLVVNLGKSVRADRVDKDTFSVYVKRVLPDGALTVAEAMKVHNTISLGSEARDESDLQGYREITAAYVTDENCNPLNANEYGEYVVIEMKVGPTDNLGAALNFDLISFFNAFVKSEYTITLNNKLPGFRDFIVDNYKGDIRPIVDDFKFGHYAQGPSSRRILGYASYSPGIDDKMHPLIVWLHGGGEGGNSSPALPIMGNKATALAQEPIQQYFGGAYVLAPQCPTMWMEGVGRNGFADGKPLYEEILMDLIKDYVKANPDIDTSRIYVGGDSNGGYMTLCLVRDYPDYFAAGFPVCEGLADSLITDEDLANIAKTPLWFVAAKTDTTLPPNDYAVPTVERLRKIDANVHFTYFDNVKDTSGLYFKEDGSPHEYAGHWSWIYVYNDEVEDYIDGKPVKLMAWLAAQKR